MDHVAVLVDGDNIGGAHAGHILDLAGQAGSLRVVRVYADARRAGEWDSAPGCRLVHAGTGKNASDLLLAVDAMELALSHGIRRFVIATSDRDFVHLVLRLREYGAWVTGIGLEKTPEAFRAACAVFHQIGGPPAPPLGVSASAVTDLDRKIRAMIATNSSNGGGMAVALLGARMHAGHGVRISTYPERTWRAYLEARPDLYDLDPRGPEARVRFRPAGFVRAA